MRWQWPSWPSMTFLLVVTLIGVYAIVGYKGLNSLAGDYAWTTHSHEVLREVDAVLTAALESETSARGYVITGDEAYVAEYESAARRSAAHLGRLRALTPEDPGQLTRVARLEGLVGEKYGVLRELIRLRREQGFNVAQTSLMQKRSPELMDQILAVIAEMRTSERELLARRAALSHATYDTALRAGAVMALVALLFLTFSYMLFWRAFTTQQEAARALESRKAELEQAVRRRTAELQEFSHELERSNRELEQFAFVASHDLQEPLRKIQTFADRLGRKEADALGEEGRDFLERIANAATRMRRLIDDLLAFSRVHTQGQPFRAVDVAQVVRDVLVDLEDQVERTRGRVEVGPLPTIQADPFQMRQLFQNLIGNALKFHRPEEPPVVRIEAEVGDPNAPRLPPPDDGTACRIIVRDNGIGFAPTYSEKIFEVFQRLHGRSEFEGSGMGLAISRRIVERHGGRISAHGQPGHGATFVVVLPLIRSTKEG